MVVPQVRFMPAQRRNMTTRAVTGTVAAPTVVVPNDCWVTGVFASGATAGDIVTFFSSTGAEQLTTVRFPTANASVFVPIQHPVFAPGGITTLQVGIGAISYTVFYADFGEG